MRTFILFSIISFTSFGYEGVINFTPQEIDNHRDQIWNLVNQSESCLQRHKKEHIEFYNSNCFRTRRNGTVCISKFYGERRYTMKEGTRRSDGDRLEYLPEALRKYGLNPNLANEMRQTSCVGLALQCLKEGFSRTGQMTQWNKIMVFVRANGVGGTALQHALRNIGWKTYYWNPVSPWRIESEAKKWDKEEKRWQSKGWHFYRYLKVTNNGTYWFNTVDDSEALVGFDKQVPRILYDYPFWVGTAHTGYHVFPGTFEKVVEAHSTRHFTARDNLEFSDFNPFATGGGPRWTRTEKYRSGLIVLPPLY